MAQSEQTPPSDDLLASKEPSSMSREVMGMWVGAAVGFGVGMVFALGGFWAGLLCLIFTLVGAILGRVFLSG